MNIKEAMIEAVERGWTTEREAYEFAREQMAEAADLRRKTAKENPQKDWDSREKLRS